MSTMASRITDAQAQIKENIKATRHWPLWGEFIYDTWIPLTKVFTFDDVSMKHKC